MPVKKNQEDAVQVLGSKTTTKWINLQKLKVQPASITVMDYKPYHGVDFSSHTKIVPAAQNMVDQLERSGGGFKVKFKPASTGWIGWMDLQGLGIELVDFRCAVCNSRIPLNPNLIAPHFKIHRSTLGKPRQGGEFYLTISRTSNPLPESIEADEDIDVGPMD